MRTEPNLREPTVDHALFDGDFVQVVLNGLGVPFGFFGRVMESDERFLHLLAHSQATAHWEITDECMCLETVIPWNSIAWIAHAKVKPFSCECLVA